MPLTAADPHYWKPISTVMDWLTGHVIKPKDFVVDVGCGHCPFPRADVGVDRLGRDTLLAIWDKLSVKARPKTVQCDFARHPLPFGNKEVDFVFCRHTIEDMYDPFLLLGEMQRVGKAGYIETPSPIVEMVRGVDGYANSEQWRGYAHHRYFIWVNDEMLNFVGKFPLCEYFVYPEQDALEAALRKYPQLWNTYFLWNDEMQAKHFEDPFDYKIGVDYGELLWRATMESARATNTFCDMVNKQMKQVTQ